MGGMTVAACSLPDDPWRKSCTNCLVTPSCRAYLDQDGSLGNNQKGRNAMNAKALLTVICVLVGMLGVMSPAHSQPVMLNGVEMIDLGQPPLTSPEMNEVMNWIAVRVAALEIPYCWRQSYGNTVGGRVTATPLVSLTPASQAWSGSDCSAIRPASLATTTPPPIYAPSMVVRRDSRTSAPSARSRAHTVGGPATSRGTWANEKAKTVRVASGRER